MSLPRSAVPEIVRRIARRLLKRSNRPHKMQLSLQHGSDHILIEGRLADGCLVEALRAQISGAIPARAVRIGQQPDSRFSFKLDLATMYAELGAAEGSFDFFLEFRDQGASGPLTVGRLGNFVETERDRAVDPIPIADTTAWLHITSKGNVSLHFGDTLIRRVHTVTHKLSSGRSGMAFHLTIETFSRPVESMVCIFVGRQSGRRTEREVVVVEQPERRRSGAGLFCYDVRGGCGAADLNAAVGLDGEVLDIHVELRLSGVEQPAYARILRPRRLQGRTREIIVSGTETSQLLIPFFTFKGKRLAFTSERFGNAELALMRRLRWISWAFLPLRPMLGIWLLGEAPYKAQDNGLAFFRWLRTNRPKRRAYYVIAAGSNDRARVEPYGNVLLAHSRKHILYSMLASRFVGTHNSEYLYASRTRWMERRCRGLRIFLQHGVLSTKNMALNYGRRQMQDKPFDKFLVSSDLERQLVIQELDYLPSQVEVTGLARFDTLFLDDVEVQRRILVMPTWRDWLSRRSAFEESEFLARWRSFLSHPELAALAAANNLSIELALHPNMRQHVDLLDIPGVTIREFGDDVQMLLKSSAVLITDYSSVHWDFSFLGRPVLYFQFDKDRFLEHQLPYVDFSTQFPGSVARTEDRLLALLRELVDNDLRRPEAYGPRSRALLKYHDRENCERIELVVRHAGGPRTRLSRLRSARIVREAYSRFRHSAGYHPTMTWLFRFARLLPRRQLVVFESTQGSPLGGSPRALYEGLLARGSELDMSVVDNTAMRLPGMATRKVRRLSPRYYWDLGRARYWVFNQNVGLQFRPAKRTYFLQTWHGTPLKKMQNDVPVMFGRQAGYHDRVRRMVSYWSALISSGPFATGAFRSAFGFTGPILETGTPCNDIFFAPDLAERSRTIRDRLGVEPGRRIVLYAPTFRDDKRNGGSWSADLVLDFDAFAARFGDDTTLLVRFHPLVKQQIAPDPTGRVLDASGYRDIQELLLVSDVLITDYSSVMFDFAQTGRQTLFFSYDIEHYRDELRGFYLDFEAEAPGPLLVSSDEVLAAIADIDAVTAKYAAPREAFRRRFCGSEDGHATDRVLDAVFGPADSPGQ